MGEDLLLKFSWRRLL